MHTPYNPAAGGPPPAGGQQGGASPPHLPSHRDLLHIAGMGSALGVGFPPNNPPPQKQEEKPSINSQVHSSPFGDMVFEQRFRVQFEKSTSVMCDLVL